MQVYLLTMHIKYAMINILILSEVLNMAMKNITMRIDENLKNEAEHFFEDLGMSMTTAYTIFLKQSLRKQKIPFEITREPNAETIEAIKEVEAMKRNPNLYKSFKSVEALMEDLNNDDEI